MPENLNWNFNLMDGVAGPAADMASALAVLSKQFQGMSKTLDVFEQRVRQGGMGLKDVAKEAKESKSAFSGVTAALGEIGLAIQGVRELAGPGLEMAGWAWDQAWDFGKKGLEALAFKETTLASFQTLLGSAKEAQDFFGQAAWLAKATPFQTKDVVEQYQRLLSAGFTKQEVPVVFQMVGDAAALRGFDPQVMNHITNALAHIMSSAPSQMGGALRMLSMDAAGTGFNRGKLNTVLGKAMGVDPESVEGLLSAGKITSRQLVASIIDQMAEAGGGMTGGRMKALENTWQGITSTLESTFQDFFLTKAGTSDDVKGFQVMKEAAINLRTALDTTQGAGKHLQDAVVGAFSNIATAIFGVGTGPDGLSRMQQLIEKAAIGVDNFGKLASIGFEAAWEGVLAFGDELGLTKDKIGGLFDGPLDGAKLEVLKTQLVEMAKEAGTELAKFAKSLVSIAGSLETISDTINIARTADDYGRNMVLGFRNAGHAIAGGDQEGYYRTDTHRQATLDLDGNPLKKGDAKMDKSPASTPKGAGAVTVQVLVDARGAKDPSAVADAAKSGTMSGLQQHSDSMRRVAEQGGVH